MSSIVNYLLPLGLIMYSCKGDGGKANTTRPVKPNILFISIDDLRPELGCFGHEYIKSPNIDRLAESATLFTNHFVQVPTCGASRYSMLTGMFPRTSVQLDNGVIQHYISSQEEKVAPETFIHHLRREGYHTVGIGKIGHSVDGYLYEYRQEVSKEVELPNSWDEILFDSGKWGTGWNAFFGYANGENRQSMNNQVKPYEMADVDDLGYPDGRIAELAVNKLGELAKSGSPFFMGVGFFKPHLPFNSPKKYWDLYDRDNIPLSPNPFIPENVNPASLHNSNEFNSYRAGDERPSLENPVSDEYARTLNHAYFACVSYIDAQVGKLLDELERLDLAENTVIIIWGDHGWHLGDHQVWGKHTLFERALNSAFILYDPRLNNGRMVSKVVSSIDIYPTIIELCGLDMPHQTDGRSLLPLMVDPDSEGEEVAYSYFRNGLTMRTERYRITKYFREEQPVIELYDHQSDPNETRNVAGDHADVVERLLPILEKGNIVVYN